MWSLEDPGEVWPKEHLFIQYSSTITTTESIYQTNQELKTRFTNQRVERKIQTWINQRTRDVDSILGGKRV